MIHLVFEFSLVPLFRIDKKQEPVYTICISETYIITFSYNNKLSSVVFLPVQLLFPLQIQMKTCPDLRNVAQNVPAG